MTKLNAWLRLNHLTEEKGDYVAIPQAAGSLNITDLVADLQKEGMEIKAETAVDIITRFNRKAAERVLSGYNVNTGLVYMRPVIKGVFRDKTWNPAAHSVYVAMNQGMARSRGYLSVRWSLEQEKPYKLSTKYKFDYVDFQFTTLTGFTSSALR